MKLEDLKNTIGIGVAGNFAKHLEQAGEMADFENVVAKEGAPKGIFPFYFPVKSSFLQTFPLSNTKQNIPENEKPQVEPEVALFCELIYKQERVVEIKPLKFTAFNDCTIRKEGAEKISEKKNWGECSKGISLDFIDLDKFSLGGVMDGYNLASFVKRDGVLHPYGVDTEVLGYSYFYETLLQWIVEKLNTQEDFGPLEDFPKILKENNYPTKALISIGATAYAEFGEKNYLKKGDEIIVALYPKEIENITELIANHQEIPNASVLQQTVE